MKNLNNIKKDNKQPIKNTVNTPVNTAQSKIKNQDMQGDNCPVNPAEGISYLPPKDENKL